LVDSWNTSGLELYGVFPFVPRTDSDDLIQRGDKYLAIADLSRARGLDDGLQRAIQLLVLHHYMDHYLWKEFQSVLAPPIGFRMPLLSPESFDLGYRQTVDADFCQRGFDFVELERFDDRFYFFMNDDPFAGG